VHVVSWLYEQGRDDVGDSQLIMSFHPNGPETDWERVPLGISITIDVALTVHFGCFISGIFIIEGYTLFYSVLVTYVTCTLNNIKCNPLF